MLISVVSELRVKHTEIFAAQRESLVLITGKKGGDLFAFFVGEIIRVFVVSVVVKPEYQLFNGSNAEAASVAEILICIEFFIALSVGDGGICRQ